MSSTQRFIWSISIRKEAGLKLSLVTAAVPSSNPGFGTWQGSGRPGSPVSSTT